MVYRKNLKITLMLSTVSLVLGYSDVILSKCFDYVFGAKGVEYTESACTQKTATLVCGKSLVIDLNKINPDFGLFIGGMYPTGEIICDNGRIIQEANQNDLTTLRQSKTGSIVTNSQLAKCEQKIFIHFYGTSSNKRFGIYTGRLVQAASTELDRINEIFNFINLLMPNLLLGLFLSTILLTFLISKAYPNISMNLILCIVGCCVLAARSGTTGLIGIALNSSVVSLYISNFFIICFAWVTFKIKKTGRFKFDKPFYDAIAVAAFITCGFIRPACSFYLAGVLLLFMGIKGRNTFQLALSTLLFSDASKMVFGLPQLPLSYVSVLFVLLDELRAIVTFTFKSFTMTKHVEDYSELYSQSSHGHFETLIKKTEAGLNIYGIHSWTLCLVYESRAHLLVKKNGNISSIHSDHVPPIFARAISMGKPVLNEDENWVPLNQIKKAVSQSIYGGKFSIYPIQIKGNTLGALSINNPDPELYLERVTKVDFEKFIQSTLDFLSKELEFIKILEKDNWHQKLEKIESAIGSDLKTEALIESVTRAVSDSLDCAAVLAVKPSESEYLNYKSVYGSSSEAKELYLGLKTSVNSPNQMGPIPLSIKTKKPIILADVSFMKNWLQSKTLKLFELNSTESAVSIPLLFNEELKGILWLESKQRNFFHNALEPMLVSISHKIATALVHSEDREKVLEKEKLFNAMVPIEALDKKTRGLATKVEQLGEITMIDIRKSTELRNKIGADAWKSIQSSILERVKPIIQKNNYELSEFTWDAIYLTKKMDLDSFNVNDYLIFIDTISNQIAECINILDIAQSLYTGKYVRICSLYGDISFDFTGASGLEWSVVGEAIAQVSKVEQMAKLAVGDVFLDSRLAANLTLNGIEKHNMPEYKLSIVSYDLSVLKNQASQLSSQKEVA